jgi:hypothetical protein
LSETKNFINLEYDSPHIYFGIRNKQAIIGAGVSEHPLNQREERKARYRVALQLKFGARAKESVKMVNLYHVCFPFGD